MPLLETFGNAAVRGYRLGSAKPSQPVINSVVRDSNTSVLVSFTVATNGAPLTAVNFSSSPSVSLGYSGTTSPMIITGTFAGNQAYTFTMTATNAVGTSPASNASNSVTPNLLPVVSGGTLTSDATYYYRTFTASGSLSITNSTLNFDTFTMGGGSGAGSNGFSGYGGGAGGFYRNDSVSNGSGSYTVTIGAGGPGVGGQPLAAQMGSATTFGSFTANGGGTTGTGQAGQSGGSGGGGSVNATNGAKAGNGGVMGANGTAGSQGQAGGSGSGAGYSIAVSGAGGIGGTSANSSYGAGAGGGAGVGNGGNGATGSTGVNGGNGGTGAGGGSGTGALGGNGGSGTVIVRYTRAQVGG